MLFSYLDSIRYELNSIAGAQCPPAIYFPLSSLFRRNRGRVKQRGIKQVYCDTELVLEAFPRSANSFAMHAFQMAQTKPVKIAHHLHVPVQIIAGVQQSIPTLVIVRQPEDSVCSAIIRQNVWQKSISLRSRLRCWIRFYESLIPYQSGFVVATFEQVTTNFGLVIERVNSRFNTDFSVFEHSPENVDACFKIIEEMNIRRFGENGKINEQLIARPSKEREQDKKVLMLKVRQEQVLLDKAHQFFKLYSKWAECD